MTEVVQPWSTPVVRSPQTDLAGQFAESLLNRGEVERGSSARKEQILRNRLAGPMALAALSMVRKHLTCGFMQRNQALSSIFASLHRQQSRLQVYILKCYITRFPHTQT